LQFGHLGIPATSRAQIIDDAFNLARAGILDYDLVMNLTRYLVKEKDYIVWAATRRGLGYLEKMLSRTGSYGAFQVGMAGDTTCTNY
jgi:hypothetical protein